MRCALPFHLRLARAMVDRACEHEEQIGQPVHVREQVRVDLIDAENWSATR